MITASIVSYHHRSSEIRKIMDCVLAAPVDKLLLLIIRQMIGYVSWKKCREECVIFTASIVDMVPDTILLFVKR